MPAADGLTADEQQRFEERAAIMEYEASLSHDEAERAARTDVMNESQTTA